MFLIRFICLLNGYFKFVFFFFQKAKALNAKKEEGNQKFRAGHLQAAYDLYSEALAIDPYNKFTNSKLYCNRATCGSKVSCNDMYTYILMILRFSCHLCFLSTPPPFLQYLVNLRFFFSFICYCFQSVPKTFWQTSPNSILEEFFLFD